MMSYISSVIEPVIPLAGGRVDAEMGYTLITWAGDDIAHRSVIVVIAAMGVIAVITVMAVIVEKVAIETTVDEVTTIVELIVDLVAIDTAEINMINIATKAIIKKMARFDG